MGMFDDVTVELPCPKCGHTVRGFQSKDGPCELLKLSPAEVNHFYASCPECKTWVEYARWMPTIPDRAIIVGGVVFALHSPSPLDLPRIDYDDAKRTAVALTVYAPIPLAK